MRLTYLFSFKATHETSTPNRRHISLFMDFWNCNHSNLRIYSPWGKQILVFLLNSISSLKSFSSSIIFCLHKLRRFDSIYYWACNAIRTTSFLSIFWHDTHLSLWHDTSGQFGFNSPVILSTAMRYYVRDVDAS